MTYAELSVHVAISFKVHVIPAAKRFLKESELSMLFFACISQQGGNIWALQWIAG
jgi:hypothetical protein